MPRAWRALRQGERGEAKRLCENAPPINYTEYFGYDLAGNMLTYRQSSPTLQSFGIDLDNQFDSPSGFNYDGEGSLLSQPTASGAPGPFSGATLQYDPEDRLTVAANSGGTLLSATYDGDGTRATKTTSADGTSYYLTDEPEAVEDRIASGKPTYRINLKHVPRSGHFIPGASVLPGDAEEAYAAAVKEYGTKGTWWALGKEGWYRYNSDNAGTAHYTATFHWKYAPQYIVRGWKK